MTLPQNLPRAAAALFVLALAAGCGSVAPPRGAGTVPSVPGEHGQPATAQTRAGGYYLDDGPGDNPPPNLDQVADAQPKPEPIKASTGRPYTVLGQTYIPLAGAQPYKEKGMASWYGRKFHGKKTASGEIYDMYGMSAAHTILPIPSYARVTNLSNGKSVVVRVNDRGPFHSGRIIDLSYTAAYKLGMLAGGSTRVEVEALLPDAGTPTAPPTRYAASPSTPPSPDASPAAGGVLAALSPIATAQASELPAAPLPAAPRITPDSPYAQPSDAAVAQPPAEIDLEHGKQGGIFLQLGAFSSRDNADNFTNRMAAQAGDLKLHVYRSGKLYKVHAGPYADAATARSAAKRVADSLGVHAVVVTR